VGEKVGQRIAEALALLQFPGAALQRLTGARRVARHHRGLKAEPISTAAPSTPEEGRRSATTPPTKYPTVSAASTVEISAAQV
jgi:hypothetical protein